jgi:trans-aconitate methyltransferase
MKISQEDVRQFKGRYSDENKIIADIIQGRLSEHFEETIVDVGAGTGDITTAALPSKRVVQIDILDYAEYALSEKHCRLVVDFFDYAPRNEERVGTLFFSHVLQFIDQDGLRLNRKVSELAPRKIITVTNVNDGFMGELLAWVRQNLEHANPEVNLPDFPCGYRLKDEVMFEGHISCEDYHSLGKQVEYLMDSEPTSEEEAVLRNFLREKLAGPTFTINQRIRVYEQA